jgi:hypothetical protein
VILRSDVWLKKIYATPMQILNSVERRSARNRAENSVRLSRNTQFPFSFGDIAIRCLAQEDLCNSYANFEFCGEKTCTERRII